MSLIEPWISAVSPQASTEAFLEALAQESLREALDKEDRLRRFYLDPFGDGSERWFLAEFCLDYLRQYKTDDKRRKDGVRQSRLHELDPCLWYKSLIEAGLLPRRVTYQVNEEGQRLDLAEEEQSIELIFCIHQIHDLAEDFVTPSPEGFLNYIYDRIQATPVNPEQAEKMLRSAAYLSDCLRAISFYYKVRGPDEQEQDMPVHGRDLSLYVAKMEEFWPAAAAKPADRVEGLTTRFPQHNTMPEFFSLEKNNKYSRNTFTLFYANQWIERSMKRYPELADYLNVINQKLNVAYRCFTGIVNLEQAIVDQDKEIHPETARIDILDYLSIAARGSQHMDPDARPLITLLKSLQIKAARTPELSHVVMWLEEQFDRYIREHSLDPVSVGPVRRSASLNPVPA